jgi:ArsR family transcriptional regulator, arsenate/arsenite/antimonite-responsive transcriptional repressor
MKGTDLDTAQIARMFHALSDETRVKIMRQLSSCECCVCDLQSELEAAQSRLSFHLKVLKDAGLVSDRKEGRWSYYSVNREVLDAMSEFLGSVDPGEQPGWEATGSCCG